MEQREASLAGNRIVLCELAWVLDRKYGYRRAAITSAIEALLTDPGLTVEDAVAGRRALTRLPQPGHLW